MARMFRRNMGVVRTPMRAFAPDGRRDETVELLVETGSTLTWIPEDVAVRLSIEPTGRALFETADGRILERPIGDALVDVQGSEGFVGVVFARPDDATVLGVTALERLGLEVDPVRRVLRRAGWYLALRALPQACRGSVISP